MPIFDRFPGPTQRDPFASWPLTIQVPSLSIQQRELPLLFAQGGTSRRDENFLPTLLIGLGKSGEAFLKELQSLFSHADTEWPSNVRAILITLAEPSLSPAPYLRIVGLQQSLTVPKANFSSPREQAKAFFGYAVNYKKYQTWLQQMLLELEHNVQVFLVASLEEPEIGLLGSALQILRLLPSNLGRAGILTRVLLFLSLFSSHPVLSAEDAYAAFREIGRLSFPGPHLMDTSFGLSARVDSSLVDFLFLIAEPPVFSETRVDFGISQEKRNPGPIIAESVFTLLHSSAFFIWENVANDLRICGNLQQAVHLPPIHALGIACAYIPLAEMRHYIATRLLQAVLWGEHPSRAEGFLLDALPPARSLSPEEAGRRLWQSGPLASHPFFDWLNQLRGPQDLKQLPKLPGNFIQGIEVHLAQNVLNSLRQRSLGFMELDKGLEWLDTWIGEREEWLKSSEVFFSKSRAPEYFEFHSLLQHIRKTLQVLRRELQEWRKVLFQAVDPGKKSLPSWRSPLHSVPSSEMGFNLHEHFSAQRKATEQKLRELAESPISRSVIGRKLDEVENYYSEAIRPELGRYTDETSPYFLRLQQRLDWWIRLAPGQPPHLCLICWPEKYMASQDPPPKEVCFSPQQGKQLADTLFTMALAQTQLVESDLGTVWFAQQVPRFVDFLHRAQEVYLEYDADQTALFPGSGQRRSYLISSDPVLSRSVVADIFTDLPQLEVNEITNGPRTRFTVLTLRLNILPTAVLPLREAQQKYQLSASTNLHVYPAEQNAILYEKRFWKNERQRVLLVPEIVLLLPDLKLVTLFFQAVFCGVIAKKYSPYDAQNYWVVQAMGDYDELPLAPADENGLVNSLRLFALELPHAPDLSLKPMHPFHPSRRDHYIASMIRHVKSVSITEEGRKARQAFSQEEMARWEKRAKEDALAQSFYVLLRCEWDEPVWSGW